MSRPRFSEGDRTGRVITQAQNTVAGVATLTPLATEQLTRLFVTAVPATMTVNLTQKETEESLPGDQIVMVFTAAAGSTITLGDLLAASGTIVLTGTNSGSWSGIFDGVNFVETSLVAEAAV